MTRQVTTRQVLIFPDSATYFHFIYLSRYMGYPTDPSNRMQQLPEPQSLYRIYILSPLPRATNTDYTLPLHSLCYQTRNY